MPPTRLDKSWRGISQHTKLDEQEDALPRNKKRTRVSDREGKGRSASPPRHPPFLLHHVLSSPSCSQSNSSSPSPPPQPGRGLGLQEAREWLLETLNMEKIDEFIERTQITSAASSSVTPPSRYESADTSHSASAASSAASTTTTAVNDSYERVRCQWLEAELGNKVKIVKFERQVVKAALEKRKFDPELMEHITEFLHFFSPGNPVPKSASTRIDMLLEVAFEDGCYWKWP